MLRVAFGEDSLSQAVVYQWFRSFKVGGISFNDDPRSSRPSTILNKEIIAQVKEKIHADRRLTIREISEDMDISFGSSQAILTEDLGMRRIVANSCLEYSKRIRNFLVATLVDFATTCRNRN